MLTALLNRILLGMHPVNIRSNMLFFDLQETIRTIGARTRVLDKWSLHKDSRGTYLRGRVTSDSEPDFDKSCIRYTSTSYLVSIIGRVATTISGSKYTLGTPLTDQEDILESQEINFKLS